MSKIIEVIRHTTGIGGIKPVYYLTLTGSNITYTCRNAEKELYYSYTGADDDFHLLPQVVGSEYTFNQNTVYFRASDGKAVGSAPNAFVFSNVMVAEGSLIEILNYQNPEVYWTGTALPAYAFTSLFQGCTDLRTTPTCEAIDMGTHCFEHTFAATAISEPMELNALTLADNCFDAMYIDCINIQSIDNEYFKDITSLAPYCFHAMFAGCVNLGNAPDLPFTALETSCYQAMFWACRSLISAPALPATDLKENCYCGMFHGCDSLTSTAQMTVESIEDFSCSQMYEECPNIVAAYNILFQYGCDMGYHSCGYMFKDCTKLVNPPTLTAQNLSEFCYTYMFENCTSLTNAPELPAEHLITDCYSHMFSGCVNLDNVYCTATSEGTHAVGHGSRSHMLDGCTKAFANLNIICDALDWDADPDHGSVGTNWVINCLGGKVTVDWGDMPEHTGDVTLTDNLGNTCIYPRDYYFAVTLPTSATVTYIEGWRSDVTYDASTQHFTVEWTICPTNYMKLEGTGGIWWETNHTDGRLSIEYSYDTGEEKTWNNVYWSSMSGGYKTSPINLPCYIRHRSNTGKYWYRLDNGTSSDSYSITWHATSNVSMYGNIQSLYDYNDMERTEVPAEIISYSIQKYNHFFFTEGVWDLSNTIIPYTTSTYSGYTKSYWGCNYMFASSTALYQPPILPNVAVLDTSIYAFMFSGCTNLQRIADMSPTEIGMSSCASMYNGCTSLTTVPTLTASIVGNGGYGQMFYGCTNLTEGGHIKAQSVGRSGMASMYSSCKKLQHVKCDAIFLNCYAVDYMFRYVEAVGVLEAYCPVWNSWLDKAYLPTTWSLSCYTPPIPADAVTINIVWPTIITSWANQVYFLDSNGCAVPQGATTLFTKSVPTWAVPNNYLGSYVALSRTWYIYTSSVSVDDTTHTYTINTDSALSNTGYYVKPKSGTSIPSNDNFTLVTDWGWITSLSSTYNPTLYGPSSGVSAANIKSVISKDDKVRYSCKSFTSTYASYIVTYYIELQAL